MCSKFNSSKNEFTVIWKIDDFPLVLKKNYSEDICSIRLSTETLDYTNWILRLVKDCERGIVCQLKRKPGGPEAAVTVSLKIIILSPTGEDLVLAEVDTYAFEVKGLYISEALQKPNGTLINLLWKDTLILKCCLKEAAFVSSVSKTSFLKSRIEVEKKDYLWSLNKLNSEEARDKICISLKPAIHEVSELIVKLILTPGDEFLGIGISTDDSRSKAAFVRCKISLLDDKGTTIVSLEDGHTFRKPLRLESWRFPNFIKRQMLKDGNRYTGTTYLKFNLSVSSTRGGKTSGKNFYNFYESPPCQELDSAESESTLGNELLRLYKDQKFCDVTLKAGGKEFGAHKNILSVRSPVFDSMFQNDMLEKNTGIVKITDVDAEILNLLLVFVYSDILDNLDVQSAMKLYQAADKYQILTLREKCSWLLKANLTPSNVVHILAFADDHQDSKLMVALKDFICLFGYELFDSEFWRNFMAKRTGLAAEIMHQASMKCLKNS